MNSTSKGPAEAKSTIRRPLSVLRVPKGGLIDNINHIKEQLGLSGSLCVAQTLEAAAGELGLKQLTGTAMEKASRILDELGC